MNISAKFSMYGAAVFAIVCLSVAIRGFTSLGDITDPTQLADAKGFAWFWTFLGGVAVFFGALTWWIERTRGDDGDA